jgi:hypothetical protein
MCERCSQLEAKLIDEVARRIYLQRAMSTFMSDHSFEALCEMERDKCLEQARNHLFLDLHKGPRPPAEAQL